jgi:NADPH-dependent 7-cyano-7-deazaguanine reductase QueF
MRVTGRFKVRGGVATTVVAHHGTRPAAMPEFPAAQGL